MARSGLDAVPAVREIDLIEVRLEYLSFCVSLFHLARRLLLAELARKAQVSAVDEIGMHVADELLSDCARAASLLTEDPAFDRSGDSDHINTVVLVESSTLDGNERLRHVARQRSQCDTRAKLGADFGDQRAVPRENLR